MVHRRLAVLVCLGLVAVTLATYSPLWKNDFIDLDDELYVTKNEAVTGGLTPRRIAWAWTTFHGGFWFPLTWISLQFDAGLFPLNDDSGRVLPNPAVFHGQNLFWHTATVLLLFAVLRRMTAAFWPSAFVAALFAVHPMHVESVAWATERKDVLSAFFWVLAMLAYARYVQAPTPARYTALFATFVVGLLAKPMLVTMPFALLLLDIWPLRRVRWPSSACRTALLSRPDGSGEPSYSNGKDGLNSSRPPYSVGWLLLEKLPLFAVAAGASWLTVVAQQSANAVLSLHKLPISARLANAIESFVWYLQKTFWPANLAVFYPYADTAWTWPPVFAAGAVLLAVTFAVIVLSRRMPWLFVGWLWFLGTLVPVIGLVQVGVQARGDRFVYVPHIGLFVAIVWTAAALVERLRLSTLLRSHFKNPWGRLPACLIPGRLEACPTFLKQSLNGCLGGACVMILAAVAWVQVGSWRDTETIWRHALAVTPANHRAHANLARCLFEQANRSSNLQAVGKLLREAADHSEKAVKLQPSPDYLYNLGVIYLLQGELERAGEVFARALSFDSTRSDCWHNLGVVDMRLGRDSHAAECFEKALALHRQSQSANDSVANDRPGVANTLANLGMARWQLGQRQAARECWDEALRLNPAEAMALNGTGLLHLRQGRTKEAAEQFAAAVRANPGLTQAHSNLGVALCRLGEWSSASRHREAIALEQNRLTIMSRPNPADLVHYRCRLAYTLNHFAQDKDARREYREALRLDPTWPERNLTKAWKLAADPRPEERDPTTAFELASQACQATADPAPAALDVLAVSQAAIGRCTEAAATARRALLKAAPPLAKQIKFRLALYEQGKPYVGGIN